jgi:hypothetical protein
MPNAKASKPVRIGRVLCTIELCQGVSAIDPRFSVVVTLPGREGAFTKSWGHVHRTMDEQEVTDMMVWIQRTVANAIVIDNGVQEVLPSQ